MHNVNHFHFGGMNRWCYWFVLVLTILAAGQSFAQNAYSSVGNELKVALVIGNSRYRSSP